MTRFDIQDAGRIRCGLSEQRLTQLYSRGTLAFSIPCRVSGTLEWQTLDTCLPLLKWHWLKGERMLPVDEPPRRSRRKIAVFSGFLGLLIAVVAGICYRGFSPAKSAVLETHSAVPLEVPVTRTVENRPLFVQPPRVEMVASASQGRPSVRTTGAPINVPKARPAGSSVEPAVEEFTIPLDRRAQVTSSHGSFSALIHDHGVETFSVSINGERTRRLEKIKGFESTATNLAFIHTLSGARVYYVDRISVASNCCVLKVVPDHRPIARQ